LRTLALGLIATHPPEVLNLVLVDFKGGATFLGFERLSHTAAVITNLSDEAHLVTRMRDALAGEMTRRQETLRAAGNFANVRDYDAAREAGAAIPRLPALLIVVDEFSELLSQHPDFAELFVAIGRVGRSLGMHLLLASQRLRDGIPQVRIRRAHSVQDRVRVRAGRAAYGCTHRWPADIADAVHRRRRPRTP
jgi:S-DNA-T family DNA segregation ATPase FtsK/SpoIIIE